MRFIVNAATGEFALGEIVELDPELFVDEIEAQVLSPIDEHGHRIIEVE